MIRPKILNGTSGTSDFRGDLEVLTEKSARLERYSEGRAEWNRGDYCSEQAAVPGKHKEGSSARMAGSL